MRVGFIITSPYQLFHFGRIAEAFPLKTAYIEVREEDFGLTSEMVEASIPGAEVVWVNSSRLGHIDGQCDVLVCHTPVPIMHFFTKSLVVTQQYSLAKERYQYGVWRAQANLNLMYGAYSAGCVSGFTNSVAVGNPLLDSAFEEGRVLKPLTRATSQLRVLYMPTYGDLSNKHAVVRSLLDQGVSLTIKLHHAERDLRGAGSGGSFNVVGADVDPIESILQHDVVVSDYSGAIYDSLAVRRPVLAVDALNAHSADLHRLPDEDRSRSDISGLVGRWCLGTRLEPAYEEAFEKLSDDERHRWFLDRYFVNLGIASRACADQIRRLAEQGEPQHFNVAQVREANRKYILENRQLRAQLAAVDEGTLRGNLRRIRSMPPKVAAVKVIRWCLRRTLGGNYLLEAFRALRAKMRSEVSNALAPAEALDPWSLPVRPIDRRRALLRIVENALRRAGVDCRTYFSDFNAYCAVRQADLDKVRRAVIALGRECRPGCLSVWLCSGGYVDKPRSAESLSLSVLAEYESLTIGVPYENQAYGVGRRGGVEIVVVEPRDVRLVAKRWLVEKADWTLEFGRAAGADATALRRPALRKRERKHVLEDEPIDVVYTWVDSTDRDWQVERSRCAAERHIELQASSNEERYINRDELKYSLRSLWLYAPFIRNIYIVTAGHRPPWLDLECNRVSVVTHEDIFPEPADLPTFNSHAIEACLHRIPGLSEHFLYFNDDVFLGRETTCGTFFTSAGLMKSRLSPSGFTTATEPDMSAIPTDWASYNAVRLMLDDFGIFFDRRMKHVPMPLRRSLLQEIEERYEEQVAKTRASRFRAATDLSLPSMLAHYYGIATGRAVEWEGKPREYAYADTGRKDFVSRLRAIRKDKPMFVCLNVTRHTDIDLGRQAALLQEYLSETYPIPSPYEISDAKGSISMDPLRGIAMESGGSE